ncbi:universal stress protein [Nocardia sp. MW-W600-9]
MPARHAAPVVVGVDGSDAALTAVRWAAKTAALRQAPLHLVHAMSSGWDLGERLGVVGLHNQRFHDEGAAGLATAERVARSAAGPLTVHRFLVRPSPVAALRRRARKAEVIVVGSRGLDRFERTVLGSVSGVLARRLACPLAVVPDTGSPAAVRDLPVLVGVDGSRGSSRALDHAVEEASLRGVGLVALFVWAEPDPGISWADMPEHCRRLLSEQLVGLHEKYPDVAVTRVVDHADPVPRLLDESTRSQLIVLGSHGRSGFTRNTLGSVSRAVLHDTQVPLLLVGHRR